MLYPSNQRVIEMRKKPNGWIVIATCIIALAAAVAVIFAIGQMG